MVANVKVQGLEAYLSLDPAELPEGHYEYWDGELVSVMSESIDNIKIAQFLFLMLVAAGIPFQLICTHACEVVVSGSPRTRFPDLVVLEPAHLQLLKSRATITSAMPAPRLVVEVVSLGDEDSVNYRRDYVEKAKQYAERGIAEYWLIDPLRAQVLVGRLAGDRYDFVLLKGEDAVATPLCPDWQLTAAQLLRGE
jgi:Uma2 family endonuclease